MDHIPPVTSGVVLFNQQDITPETVMSDLNIFRSANPMPHWVENGSAMPTSQRRKISESDSILGKHAIDSGSETSSDYQVINTEENLSYPMSPPQTEPGSSSSGSNKDEEEESTEDTHSRKKRHPIPDEKKDDKYWERRRKNNIAAKRSRELRRQKMDDEIKTAKDAIQENQKLKQEIEVLQSEINSLRRLLKDANMTLSLWIRARQASEPATQLPPMLRGSNVSFVNFPVSSTNI